MSRGGRILRGGVWSRRREEQRRSRGVLQGGAGHLENRGRGELWERQNLEERGGEEERRGGEVKMIKKDWSEVLGARLAQLWPHTHALSAGSGRVQVLVWVLLVPAGASGARHAATHHRVDPHLTGHAHLGQLLEVDTCGTGGCGGGA